jgi:hypothetical protein
LFDIPNTNDEINEKDVSSDEDSEVVDSEE